MTKTLPVCIVGAGLSGLSTIKQLTDRNIDVTCFELGTAFGGLWRYDNDNDRSPAYASLRIDTSKERFAFADLPMPKDWPTYLHHTQVLEYLERYVAEFDLERHITYRHEVTRVTPQDGAWAVTVRDLETDEVTTAIYGSVVVTNGHHWSPNMPDLDESFGGTVMHAQSYRTPEPFIGKDVVVVGVGNTGTDLASELSWHARTVTLATRSGAHVFPRYLFGRPLDAWSTPMSTKMPLALQRTVYSLMLFMARGRQESYGFPVPDAPILSHHPTVSDDVLRLVKDGQISVERGISRTSKTEVVFADGASTPCDIIIFATGYNLSFPFLDDSVVRVLDNVVPLYKRVVAPDRPGLYFVGLIQPVGALPPLAEQQARWVGQLIDGAPLPSEASMAAEINRDVAATTEQYQDRPRHTIQVDYWHYLMSMRAICDANDALASSTTQPVASEDGEVVDG